MISDKCKKGSGILILALPVISVFAVALIKILYQADIIDIFKVSIMTFLLTCAIALYVRFQSGFNNVRYSKIIIFFSYLISILFVMLVGNPRDFSFWMLGGLVNAMLIDKILGLLVYFNLTFILYVTNPSAGPEAIIHFLIMGVLFILLADALKNKATVIYASIILLSTNITLTFIINNFIFDTNGNVNYLISFFSIFAVLVAAFLLSVLYYKFAGVQNETVNEQTQAEQDRVAHIDVNDAGTSYDVLLSDDNELLMRIKNHSQQLYNHCRMIGDLSGRAAGLIGADENLARAGGYYHEIGKIIGSNYIEEGLKLADKYSFPEKIKDIIRQHNIKYDRPTFKEAAIVMISDNVASTIEYINKTGDKKYSSDKIIDDIFRLRMEKGTFDDSGLTIKDFKLLNEFFRNEFKTTGKTDKEDAN